MATFSKLTGASPTVLRAWEHRHGLLEPARRDGGHRLYTDEDLRVIRRVMELLQEGRAIGEIAAVGRSTLLNETRARVAPEEPDGFAALVSQLVAAARDIDVGLLSRALDRAFSLFSVESVVARIIQPAAHEVGELWALGQVPIAGEHMFSAAVSGRIERLLEVAWKPDVAAPLVVCACLPEEQHELGLLVLTLYLAHAGLRISYLGRDLPLAELEKAAERLEAKAVCLSGKQMDTVKRCERELAQLARRWSGRIAVHLGGVGSPERLGELVDAGVHVWPPSSAIPDLISSLR